MIFAQGAETKETEGAGARDNEEIAVGLVAPKTFILEAVGTAEASEFMFEIQERLNFCSASQALFDATGISLCTRQRFGSSVATAAPCAACAPNAR
jgi:hypothetical protein